MVRRHKEYVVYNKAEHSVSHPTHKEMQAHSWFKISETQNGFEQKTNAELAQALLDWMKADPKWKKGDTLKAASAWIKANRAGKKVDSRRTYSEIMLTNNPFGMSLIHEISRNVFTKSFRC